MAYTYDEAFGKTMGGTSSRLYRKFNYLPLYEYSYRPNNDFSQDIDTIIKSMPVSFIFRPLPENECGFALNRYSGYDYRGPNIGRLGNLLRHAIVCNSEDVATYPCEYYNSSMFVSFIPYEQLNAETKPDFLPEPVIVAGCEITVDAVRKFLSFENRIDVFKQMVYAYLNLSSEKKRIIICDDNANIIYWIAAIEYVFPLKLAKQISFTTYIYDPKDGLNQPIEKPSICGVNIEKSNYSKDDVALQNQAYIFDLINGICPENPINESFYNVVEEAFMYDIPDSYSLISDFHDFLNPLDIGAISSTYVGAMAYYEIMHFDINMLRESSEFKQARMFIESLPNLQSLAQEFVNKLISDLPLLFERENPELFLLVLKFICQYNRKSEKSFEIKSAVIQMLLAEFRSDICQENSYEYFTQAVFESTNHLFNLHDELKDTAIILKYISELSDSSPLWKLRYVDKLLKDSFYADNNKNKVAMLQSHLSSLYLFALSKNNDGEMFIAHSLYQYCNEPRLVYSLLTMVRALKNITATTFLNISSELFSKISALDNGAILLGDLVYNYVSGQDSLPHGLLEGFVGKITIENLLKDITDRGCKVSEIFQKILSSRKNYYTLSNEKTTLDRLDCFAVAVKLVNAASEEKSSISSIVSKISADRGAFTINKVSLKSFSKDEGDLYISTMLERILPYIKTDTDISAIFGLYRFTSDETQQFLQRLLRAYLPDSKEKKNLDSEKMILVLNFMVNCKIDTNENLELLISEIDKSSLKILTDKISLRYKSSDLIRKMWDNLLKLKESKSPLHGIKNGFGNIKDKFNRGK